MPTMLIPPPLFEGIIDGGIPIVKASIQPTGEKWKLRITRMRKIRQGKFWKATHFIHPAKESIPSA
jgi:hypothetical protein